MIRRRASPEERAQARAVARFVAAIDEPGNMLSAFALINRVFPGIRLDTALAGYVFRTLLTKPEQVLQ